MNAIVKYLKQIQGKAGLSLLAVLFCLQSTGSIAFAQENPAEKPSGTLIATMTVEEAAEKSGDSEPVPSGSIVANNFSLSAANEVMDPNIPPGILTLKEANAAMKAAEALAKMIRNGANDHFKDLRDDVDQDLDLFSDQHTNDVPADRQAAFDAAWDAYWDGKEQAHDAFDAAIAPAKTIMDDLIKAANAVYHAAIKPENAKIQEAQKLVNRAENMVIKTRTAGASAEVIAEKMAALDQARQNLEAVKTAVQPLLDAAKSIRDQAVKAAHDGFKPARQAQEAILNAALKTLGKNWETFLKSLPEPNRKALQGELKDLLSGPHGRKGIDKEKTDYLKLVNAITKPANQDRQNAQKTYNDTLKGLRQALIAGTITKAEHDASAAGAKTILAGKVQQTAGDLDHALRNDLLIIYGVQFIQ